ncbi:MAG TPA: MFS transporter [Flavobacteriales bacterium]|mgnify:CR=1 FL=1|nr:MFS transporter [Flavobacteriales bacterium]HCA83013.1 MFS transporter [Flavobacteriales bacterium]HRE74164.1 MFS transporter [Flavobacteriales bacterium]HRE95200.1 MFS transporter [Flavobacteriales bacterium]HRJ36464.1 MFS transporter [Flavobacteriales bacterium]
MNRSFLTLISVFFFWGFVAASNDILIPVFKDELDLEQWQSQLISFAFYISYTVGSVLYQLYAVLFGRDLLSRIGYKNGIALGLVISASGTLLFIPAANTASYPLMLSGLFIVGLGFSLQQTAANPLAIRLGDPAKSSQRLSLAGGINNVGTTIGPVLLGLAIFGNVSTGNTIANIESIKIPYLILGAAFLLVALAIKYSKIPDQLEDSLEVDTNEQTNNHRSPLSYPQLWLGMIAIFVYVGVEVSTASNLPEYLKSESGIDTNATAPYISLFWASLMIGRWTSAAGVFNVQGGLKTALGFLMPYLAFGLFILVNVLVSNDVSSFYYYPFVILVMIAGDLLSKGNPSKQLFIFSVLGILALVVGMMTSGLVSIYAFISVGLFCSTLWPCIFTLAITGLGGATNRGSGFLIMMIMGGGLISLLQGWLANENLFGIRLSYLTGVFCFIFLAWYAYRFRNLVAQSVAK